MGLGVLEDKVLERVPGTTRYFDDPERPQAATDRATGLKCDNSGPIPIILVPQPSDDPNDPLNWPLWKRDCIVFVLSLVSIFSTALGSLLAANTLTLSLMYGRPFDDVAVLTGYYLLGVGIGGIFFVPTARVYGKRHLYVIGTVVVTISSAWAGASGKNYTSMLFARIFQGIGSAPFESLLNATVGDLYFVHQRGKRMALTNLAVFGGAFFAPIVVGKMTHSIGWKWTFYVAAIFCGVCIPFVIFYAPETAYRRAAHLDTDLTTSKHASSDDFQKATPSQQSESGMEFDDLGSGDNRPGTADTKSALASHDAALEGQGGVPQQYKKPTLSLFNGRYTDENFFKLLLRPFPLFAQPAILWACLIQGCMVGWTVFIGIILAAIFLGPPLFWDEVETGYAYTGAFLGALVGFLIAGGLSDWLAKLMTKRNNGVYEPEFRIILVVPQLVLGVIGLFGFGYTASRLVDYSWVLPVFFFGCVIAGMVVGAVASSLYIVDAHRDIAIEAFTCQLIFKNFFSFGLTYSAYGWLIAGGTYQTFMIIGGITIAICLTSIPMYIYGKRNRSYFHRNDILKAVKLR